jgi:DNA topoisomerase IB
LVESVKQLQEGQKVAIPPAFESYYAATLDPASEQGLWHGFNAALQRHTRAWQSVLKPCGMMPGGPVTPSSSQ